MISKRTATRRLGNRLVLMIAAAAALAVASIATISLADARPATQPSATSPAAQTAGKARALAAPPGVDPAIQRWFLAGEAARIRFGNQLLKAEKEIAGGSDTTNCSALNSATAALRAHLAKVKAISNGGPAIARAYGPVLDKFSAAATACVRRDYATARKILGDTKQGAIADFGAAQETVDEILDGGA